MEEYNDNVHKKAGDSQYTVSPGQKEKKAVTPLCICDYIPV